MDEQRTLYQIPADNYPAFEAKVAKLSKRAVKLGCDPILPMVFSNELKDFGKGYGKVRVYNVFFNIENPKLNGWSFAARLDHSQETGTLIRSVPTFGRDIPAHYRDAAPHCDHCRVRRYRRDSYVVCEDATDTFKQVGSSCLADFLGHDAYRMARLAEFLATAGGYAQGASEWVGADRRFIDVEDFLACAAWAVRKLGFTSKKVAMEYSKASTATVAMGCLSRNWGSNPVHEMHFDGIGWVEFEAPSDADVAFAEAARAWVQEFASKDTISEYEANAMVIAKAVVMEPRHLGLAASIIGIYARHLDREAQRKREAAERKGSEWLGNVGGKVEAGEVRVAGHVPVDGTYGTTHLYTFITTSGSVLKWFSSKSLNLLVGDIVMVAGTVKKHDVYKDVRQTVLTRCKVERLAVAA